MRIVVIGASGQLGRDLVKSLARHDLIPLTHPEIEISEAPQVRAVMQSLSPDLVINLAACHRVDECEENAELAFQVNTLGVHYLALACKEQDACLVHMSTDYVFDGRKGSSYVETDPPNPINVYGISKVAGEHFIRSAARKHFIVRTSGLYGVAGSSGKGGNFVEQMLRLAKEGRAIRVVSDQVLSPTYTVDLAETIAGLITTDRYGTYHITNAGSCSWYDFARTIFELSDLRPDLSPTTSVSFGAKAKRPAFSVLENHALPGVGLACPRPWQKALAAYLHERQQGG